MALALVLIGSANGLAAIPLAKARNYDSVGIGMVMGAGPVYDARHGLAPNQLIAEGWFHYQPTLIGGLGLDFSSRNPSSLATFSQYRYSVTSTWIPWSTPTHALEVSGIGSLCGTNTYLDTLPGADPIVDNGTDVDLAVRVGYGRRQSELIGWWVAGSPVLGIRPFGKNAGLNPGLDAEVGMTYSLQSVWHNAKTLSRAWDIFVRVPLQIQSAAPYVTSTGIHRGPTWSLGIQIGPSGLF